ncbi:MAG: hypothetical protein J0H74_22765 [Chitinophagaceae bacterium]|nr:hypothetical protein [Chitinophagaceae bacterium]
MGVSLFHSRTRNVFPQLPAEKIIGVLSLKSRAAGGNAVIIVVLPAVAFGGATRQQLATLGAKQVAPEL